MPSHHVVELCTSSDTVTKSLAESSDQEICKIPAKLFKKSHEGVLASLGSRFKSKSGEGDRLRNGEKEEKERLDLAEKCGKFPYRPSDLFLKIYADVLDTLDKNPMAGLVSPPLLGSAGVIPLSIVSVIPDIMRHYADLIVRAQSEVFIATNYWEPSHSAGLIADALKELSKRTGGRNSKTEGDDKKKKVIVKLMYDRGTPSQAVHNHAPVKVEGWEAVHIPKPEEMPNVDLEVINYHRPFVGTFHAKFMIVDRKIACLNSNNIQDRPNVEMMTHLEGPIVESFYDMALITWSNALKPPLPLLASPPTYDDKTQYDFGEESENLRYIDREETAEASRKLLHKQQTSGDGEDAFIGEHPHMSIPERKEEDPAKEDIHQPTEDPTKSSAAASKPDPQAELNSNGPSPSTADPVAAQTSLAAYDETNRAEHANVQAEIANNSHLSPTADREQVSISETGTTGSSRKSMSAKGIAKHLNAGAQDTEATVLDEEGGESTGEFSPHIMHAAHKPCPIAMVNRIPRGSPGHEDSHKVPQNVAFLGAFKYAHKSIFIQTPTFNATPVVEACITACLRGIEVTLYLDLGFNDLGEMIPFQGGTNEEVVNKMYKDLDAKGKAGHLKVYWYTAKDQLKPMNAAEKKRNCHVKFLAVDGQVAIQGNGNQDTQSWFHSQEINVMVDSPPLVAEWIKGINANQNTLLYGKVDPKDGIWRDKDGYELQASGITGGGPLGRLKGLTGAIKRVRGTGGF